jgi:hypothetical protein
MLSGLLLCGVIGCSSEDSADPKQPPGGAPGSSETSAAPGNGLDVSLVTDDYFAAVVVHPARLVKSPMVAAFLKQPMFAGQIEQIGVAPEEVERLMVLVPSPGADVGPEPDAQTIVIRMSQPVDFKERLSRFLANAAGFDGELIEKTIEGKTCYTPDERVEVVACVFDERTLVLTSDNLLLGMLSKDSKPGPLADRLRQVDLEADVIATATFAPVRDLIRAATAQFGGELPPPLAIAAGMADKFTGATVSLDLSGDRLLAVVADATDEKTSAELEKQLNGMVELGKMMLQGAKGEMPQEVQQAMAPVFSMAESALAGLAVARDGQQISVTLKRPDGLDEAVDVMVAQAVEAAQKAVQRTRRMHNLRWIALAMHTHHDARKVMPAAAVCDAEGKPLLSWRVALLPYLDESELYEAFKLDEPWNSPHNVGLLKQMPEVYGSPGEDGTFTTSIMLFAGEGTAFAGPKGPTFSSIRDRAANTIMMVEAGPDKAVPWTKPEDLPFNPEDPAAALGELAEPSFLAVFFDARCEAVDALIDPETLKGLITPAGGEDVSLWDEEDVDFEELDVVVVPVTGIVTLDGEPVDDAELVFLPDGLLSVATVAIGTTGADGTFSLECQYGEGAVPGKYKVDISAVTIGRAGVESRLPEKYGDSETSGLTAEINADGENHFRFDLRSN